ncbi:Scramblase [Posidoniimonas polymericola]|uniref:Scramblase n=1 Tax=Posidoniimonas polymericola TaxID=2528002 RepID=A0A5C5YD56_9BACT|nr:phospholipid scramblase-related protein [Posidoniimonas polymericola]TWT72713.1 Scramblase [Posidoniimonas polymericola]
MTDPLSLNLLLVKEHVGMFKAANNYDIYDPATGGLVMECREPDLGLFTKLLRFTDYKRMTPFDIRVQTPDGRQVVRITRGISILLSTVDVLDENNQRIGGFKQKFFSIGGAFTVRDASDTPVCELKGKWTGWNFRFMAGETQLAQVAKKWSGIGKEMFTSADNYILEISDALPDHGAVRKLILAAVMCIDMVLKE